MRGRRGLGTAFITDRHSQLHPVPLDPPFRTRTATLLTREGAYQTAATRAFTRLTHEYVSQFMRKAADKT